MNIAAEKAEIIRRFNEVHDAGLIKAIKSLLDFGLDRQEDSYDPELEASIDRALQQSEQGLSRPHEEVMAEIRKQYGL